VYTEHPKEPNSVYTQILSIVPQSAQQLLILHIIWKRYGLDPEGIDTLLTLRPGSTRLALRGLHSLFAISPNRPRLAYFSAVEILHASLSDYLGDARRSGSWCVETPLLLSDHLHCRIRGLSLPAFTDSSREFHL
jgi:hypothetical protein